MEKYSNTNINFSSTASAALKKQSKHKNARNQGRIPTSNLNERNKYLKIHTLKQPTKSEAGQLYSNQPPLKNLQETASLQPRVFYRPRVFYSHENLNNRVIRTPATRGRHSKVKKFFEDSTERLPNQPTAVLGKKVYFCYNNPLTPEMMIKKRFEEFGETSSFYTIQKNNDPDFIFGFVAFKELRSALSAVSQRVLIIDQNPVRVRLARERNPRKVKELRRRQGQHLSLEAQNRLKREELRPRERFSFRQRVQAEVTLRHREQPALIRINSGQRRHTSNIKQL